MSDSKAGHQTDPGRLTARQAMLAQLTTALDALLRKLGMQREVAVGACSLAPQAEEIARQARLLAFGRGRVPPQALLDLVEAVEAMAADAAAVAGEIERGAALGGEIVTAIGAQVAELAAIAQDPARLADPASLRGALVALAGTLQRVTVQRQAQDLAGQAVLHLGQQAAAFAERARRIATGGTALQEEVLALSRDLGAYAAEAARVADALSADVRAGEQVLARMTGELRGMAGAAPATAGGGLDQRISTILREGQAAGGDAVDWGVGARRR